MKTARSRDEAATWAMDKIRQGPKISYMFHSTSKSSSSSISVVVVSVVAVVIVRVVVVVTNSK